MTFGLGIIEYYNSINFFSHKHKMKFFIVINGLDVLLIIYSEHTNTIPFVITHSYILILAIYP